MGVYITYMSFAEPEPKLLTIAGTDMGFGMDKEDVKAAT